MEKLLKAYKELFGEPSTLVKLTSEDEKVTFHLAVTYPVPADDIPESSVTSLGLSEDIEFYTEIKGKVSKQAIDSIGAAYFALYDITGDDVIPGSIYQLSFPPFDKMDAVMIKDQNYDGEEFLNPEDETGRLISVVPLYSEEAEELEKVPPAARPKLLVRSEIPAENPKRKPAKIIYEAFQTVWNRIADWYEENEVRDEALLTKALDEEDSNIADELEKRLGFSLPTDFKVSFNVVHEKIQVEDYTLLSADKIIEHLHDMNKLNNSGAFKKAIEKIEKSPYVQTVWWHEHWIPVAINSFGDLIVIDMAPGKEGEKGQVLYHLNEEGPLYSGYSSFFEYLDNYMTELEEDMYEVSSEGSISKD